MGPKPSQPQTVEPFRPRLHELLKWQQPLVRLAAQLYLQHTFDASDEAV